MTVKDFMVAVIKGELAKNDILKFAKECEDRQDLCKELKFKAYAIENVIGTEIVGYTENGEPLYKRDFYNYCGANFKDAVNRLEATIGAIENMDITASSTKGVNGFIPDITLPTKLNTERGRKYLRKAIEAGIIIQTDIGYKKNGITKAQLAYLCRCIFGDASFPDAELSVLFGESRLGKANSQLLNNKEGNGKPKGFQDIDRLFEE